VAEQVVISSNDKIQCRHAQRGQGSGGRGPGLRQWTRFKIPGGFRYVEPKQNDDLRKAFFNKNKGAQK